MWQPRHEVESVVRPSVLGFPQTCFGETNRSDLAGDEIRWSRDRPRAINSATHQQASMRPKQVTIGPKSACRSRIRMTRISQKNRLPVFELARVRMIRGLLLS
ncbi:MAG: hypothetical protein CMJ64_12635 [Planctomycetaceae bacterium]|nr:hypothetical protein [Planctomycetaceae bacterium]